MLGQEALAPSRSRINPPVSGGGRPGVPKELPAAEKPSTTLKKARNSIKRIKHGFKSAAMEESSAAQYGRRPYAHVPHARQERQPIAYDKPPATQGANFATGRQRFYEALEFEESRNWNAQRCAGWLANPRACPAR